MAVVMTDWNDQLVNTIKPHTFSITITYNQIITNIAFGPNGVRQPIAVYARAYIYFMQNLEAHDLVSFNATKIDIAC